MKIPIFVAIFSVGPGPSIIALLLILSVGLRILFRSAFYLTLPTTFLEVRPTLAGFGVALVELYTTENCKEVGSGICHKKLI